MAIGKDDPTVRDIEALAARIHRLFLQYRRQHPGKPMPVTPLFSRLFEQVPEYRPFRERDPDRQERPAKIPGVFTMQQIADTLETTVGNLLGEPSYSSATDLVSIDDRKKIRDVFRLVRDLFDLDDPLLDAEDRDDESAEPAILPDLPAPPLRVEKEIPVAAGTRVDMEPRDPDELRDRNIPPEYQNQGANGVFRTEGDSMIDAGIFEGDILFVRRTKNHGAANRHIVVCRVDGTFNVKYLKIADGIITLESRKSGLSDQTMNEEEQRFELIGVVVGVTRDLLRHF